MSDRTIQVAILVVAVCVLVVAIISLARLPAQENTWLLAAMVGMLSSVVAGVLALIARPANNVPRVPPKP